MLHNLIPFLELGKNGGKVNVLIMMCFLRVSGSYQPSNELMLRFYGFYKQATEGPAVGTRPGFWDVIKRAKWDAWARLGNMSKEEAMQRYVDELNKVCEIRVLTAPIVTASIITRNLALNVT